MTGATGKSFMCKSFMCLFCSLKISKLHHLELLGPLSCDFHNETLQTLPSSRSPEAGRSFVLSHTWMSGLLFSAVALAIVGARLR